jgi:two-component system sensor kinase FixL
MSWVTIIWSMTASACLTLGLMYFSIWCRQRQAWANLMFTLMALGTAFFTFCELWLMHAGTPAQFGTLLRWMHVPTWLIIVNGTGR